MAANLNTYRNSLNTLYRGRMHAPIGHMALRSFILKFQRASYRSLSPKTSKSNSFFCAAPVHRNHYISLRARICIWDFWVHALFFCEEEEEESITPRQKRESNDSSLLPPPRRRTIHVPRCRYGRVEMCNGF